jgi:hypothetical protein
MKEIEKYLNELSIEDLVNSYENEYMPFQKTGILPDGIIRNIAEMFNKVSGSYSIDFATTQFLKKFTEFFYNQNK